jgi:hypothetical protein
MKPQSLDIFQKIHALRGRLLNHGGNFRGVNLDDLNALERVLLQTPEPAPPYPSNSASREKAHEFFEPLIFKTQIQKESQNTLLHLLLETYAKEVKIPKEPKRVPIPPSSSPRLTQPIPKQATFMERLWEHFQEEISTNWFLFLGAAMVFASGLFYSLASWSSFGEIQQFLLSFTGLGVLALSELGLRQGLGLKHSPRVFGLVFLFLLPMTLQMHFSLGWAYFLSTLVSSAAVLNFYRGHYLPKAGIALLPLLLYFFFPACLSFIPESLNLFYELGSALCFLFLQSFWKKQTVEESTGLFQGLTCFAFAVSYLPILDPLNLAWILTLWMLQWLLEEQEKAYLSFLYGAGFLLIAFCFSFEAWGHLYSAGVVFTLVLDRFNVMDSNRWRSALTLALGTTLGCLTPLMVSLFKMQPQAWHLLLVAPLVYFFQVSSLKRWKLEGYSHLIAGTWLILLSVVWSSPSHLCLHSLLAGFAVLVTRKNKPNLFIDLELGVIASFIVLPWLPPSIAHWSIASFWFALSFIQWGRFSGTAKIRLSAFFLFWGYLVFLLGVRELISYPQLLFFGSLSYSGVGAQVFPWLPLIGFLLLGYGLCLKEAHSFALWMSLFFMESGVSFVLLSLSQPLGFELPFLFCQFPIFLLVHPHVLDYLGSFFQTHSRSKNAEAGLKLLLAFFFLLAIPGLLHNVVYILPSLFLFWIYRMGTLFWISFFLCVTTLISGPESWLSGDLNLHWGSGFSALLFLFLHRLSDRNDKTLWGGCRSTLKVDFRVFLIGSIAISCIAWLVSAKGAIPPESQTTLAYLGSMTALILISAKTVKLPFLSIFTLPLWVGLLMHGATAKLGPDLSFALVLGYYALLMGLGSPRSPFRLKRPLVDCSLVILCLGFLRFFNVLPLYQSFFLALSASIAYILDPKTRYALHLLALMVLSLSLRLIDFSPWPILALSLAISGWVLGLKERVLLWHWMGAYLLFWIPCFAVEGLELGLVLCFFCLAIHQLISAQFLSNPRSVYLAALFFGFDYGLLRQFQMVQPGEYSSYGLVGLALLLGFLANRLSLDFAVYRLPFLHLSKLLPFLVIFKESLESGSPWVYLVSGFCYEFLEDDSKLSYTRLLGLVCYNLACFAFFSPGSHLLEALTICSGFSVLWYAKTLEPVLERPKLQVLKVFGNFLFYAGVLYDFVYQAEIRYLFYLWVLCIIGGWLALFFKARLQLFSALIVFLFSLGFFLIRQLILQINVGIVGIGGLGLCLIILGALIEKNREKLQVFISKFQAKFLSWQD